jgi:hypothetical protein
MAMVKATIFANSVVAAGVTRGYVASLFSGLVTMREWRGTLQMNVR